MTIILKCIENTKSLCCRTGTLTPQCWRSIILQKGTNKFMEKDGGEGELDEGSQKAQTSSYKINRLLLFSRSVMSDCHSMDCSTLGFPVLHYLPEFAQTHAHWVNDAIQPSRPLLPPSPPAFNLSQNQVFFNDSALHIRRPNYWSFSISISTSNEYSGLIFL